MPNTEHDIQITDEGARARGRNGFFIPRKINIENEADGSVTLRAYSKAVGDSAPIMLSMSRADWTKVVEAIGRDSKVDVPVDHFKSGDKVRVKGTKKILTIENYFGPKVYPPYTVKEAGRMYSREELEPVKG